MSDIKIVSKPTREEIARGQAVLAMLDHKMAWAQMTIATGRSRHTMLEDAAKVAKWVVGACPVDIVVNESDNTVGGL